MSNNNTTQWSGSAAKPNRNNVKETTESPIPELDQASLMLLGHRIESPRVRELYPKWREQVEKTIRLEQELAEALDQALRENLVDEPFGANLKGGFGSPGEAIQGNPSGPEKKVTSLRLADGTELELKELHWCDGPISVAAVEEWMTPTLSGSMAPLGALCQRAVVELAAGINRACSHVEPDTAPEMVEFCMVAIEGLRSQSGL